MRLPMLLTAAGLASLAVVPLAGSTANAATRHQMWILRQDASGSYPSWVYDNNPDTKHAALAINAGAYGNAHGDYLTPVIGTSLCLQRKPTHGGTWRTLQCKKTSGKLANVRFIVYSAPHSGWYYRIHHYTSTYYYAATSKTIHPVY